MESVFLNVASLDKATRDSYHISEELMMEHAALGIKAQIVKKFPLGSSILIVTGPGNNGADGYALARLLYGYNVYIYEHAQPKTTLCKLQQTRAKHCEITVVENLDNAYDVVVDAIFGSGLSKPLDVDSSKLVDTLNTIQGYKIACDIPTGLFISGDGSIVFRADLTVTMGAHKIALYSDFAKDFVGVITTADLGVSHIAYSKNNKPDAYLLENIDLTLPIRNKPSKHKGNYGHLAVFAGNKEGAGILSASAGLSFGAGLVTLIAKEKILIPADLMQSQHLPNNTNTICIGNGLGDTLGSNELLSISKQNTRFVVDADMFYKKEVMYFLDKNTVLTPHPKEFASLLGICGFGEYSTDKVQNNRFELAKVFSEKYPSVALVLKGANTTIATSGELYICSLGSVSLAKGGSGDVLAGMIGALLAQGYDLLEAAKSAVLAHALASQKIKNNYALTPRDLIEAIKVL